MTFTAPMRVALVTSVFPPDNGWGGIGTYAWHLARGLTARGHQVSVLCGYQGEPSVRWEGGIRVVRRVQTAGVTALERSRQIAAVLEEEILTQGIDVVEFGEYGGEGVVFQQRHPSFPVVVKLHAPTRLCARGEAPGWQQWLRRRYLPRGLHGVDALEQESVERARVVLSPSRWLLDVVRDLGWSLRTFAVVRNPFGGWPVDLSATDPQEVSADPPAEPSSGSSTPSVLVLGRLARLKGADVLPEVFRRVWREMPTVRFEWVGQDTLRTATESWRETILRRTAPSQRGQLIFRGGVAYPNLPQVLTRHSLAVFASRWESSSYTVMECMWAGLACVVGSGGGAQELGEDGVSVVNTARRAPAIAAAVIERLRDTEGSRRLGRAARMHVRAEFAPAAVALEMERQYRRAGVDTSRLSGESCPSFPTRPGGASMLSPVSLQPPQPDLLA